MIAKKRPPVAAVAGPWSAYFHDSRHGSFRDSESELEEFAVDARRSPGGIIQSQFLNEPSDFTAAFRVVLAAAFGNKVPIKPKAFAVPADDRFGLHDEYGISQCGRAFRQPNEHNAVGVGDSRPRLLAFENFDLLSQSDVFENELGPR